MRGSQSGMEEGVALLQKNMSPSVQDQSRHRGWNLSRISAVFTLQPVSQHAAPFGGMGVMCRVL